jgi:hypothetical protein
VTRRSAPRGRRRGRCLTGCASAWFAALGPFAALEAAAGADEPAAAPFGRVELKRQNTSRGTPDESTRTTLRFERLLGGPLRLLRLDLPFPDEKTDFAGDPFEPRLGDVKLRLGFRAPQVGAWSLPSFVEIALPTADPQTLGSGKVQLSAGLRAVTAIGWPFDRHSAHDMRFEAEIEHVQSVAGDADRSDIRYSKLELNLNDTWQRRWQLKLKFKPSIDWQRDAASGAVGEVEVGRLLDPGWRLWLMVGRRLWGPRGVGGTYDDRVELGLARTF